jgi:hypothetical protein
MSYGPDSIDIFRRTGSLGSRVFSMAMTGRGVHLFLL